MEASSVDLEMTKHNSSKKGGLRTMPFIIANEALQKVASFGLLPNMILYFMRDYRMDVPTGSSFLSFYGAGSNFLPVLGAFVSDSYLGRYRTILIGCITSFMGMFLLWLTAMIPQVRPPSCDPSSQTCEYGVAKTWQLFVLIGAFVLMAIGGGAIVPSLAFGADQVNGKDNSNNKNVLQTYFNWYYFSATLSVLIAMTVIVYIQDHCGWKIGFGIPAALMLMSAVSFVVASSMYVKVPPNKSLFSGFAYASVAAFRNRHIILPENGKEGRYHHNLGSSEVVPSDKLRFLNKACIIQNHEKDLRPDGSVTNKWNLCTVEQVEELKALVKVLPIWSCGILMSVTMSVPSFPLLQTNSMNRHLTKNFQIPAGSFSMFMIATLVIWIAIYDRLLIPQIAKVTGKPYGFGLKTRMGIGIVVSIAGSVVSAIVESIRRSKAIEEGFANNPNGVLDMSAYWLVPQLAIMGIAEAFYAIGQNEFYYSQFPQSMSSIAACLPGLSSAFGNLIVGVLVKVVDRTTKKGDISWVSSNLNRAHYNYYYWLLAFIGAINFVYYLGCCWAYGGYDTRIESKDSEEEEDNPKEIALAKQETN